MPGRKRAAEDSTAEKRETRSAKVPKTEGEKGAKGAGRKGRARAKTSMGATAFRSRAQPLHVNITHTEPPIEIDAAETDPGFLGAVSLVSTSFTTGSFGWKGSKRMTVDLPKLEGQEEAEKVHVMLTINATVIGSKDAKEGEEGEEGEKAEETTEAKEAEGEKPADEPAQEGAPAAAAEEGETVSS
ncbi:hypothetical protein AZE42_01797 [Rhizopogon vesiculosus]|uniref:Uncharacterized protein n=1 Tax=Rhizopogon vesiculosus TaxID=180088 RepID=A0A1J8R6T9_9AGAM|nr:hypothetical protein AZE42_01797 [Rhizopogon vesiculosus]